MDLFTHIKNKLDFKYSFVNSQNVTATALYLKVA